jgi:hypothetical protein
MGYGDLNPGTRHGEDDGAAQSGIHCAADVQAPAAECEV